MANGAIQWSAETYNIEQLVQTFPNGMLPRKISIEEGCTDECNNLTLQQGDILDVCEIQHQMCVAAEFPCALGQMKTFHIPMVYNGKLRKLSKAEFIFPTVRDMIKYFPKRVKVTSAPLVAPKVVQKLSVGSVIDLIKLDKSNNILTCKLKGKELKLPLSYKGDFEEVINDGKEYSLEDVMTTFRCPQWVSFIHRHIAKQDVRCIKDFQGDAKLLYSFDQVLLICRSPDGELLIIPGKSAGDSSNVPLFSVPWNNCDTSDKTVKYDLSKTKVDTYISMMNYATRVADVPKQTVIPQSEKLEPPIPATPSFNKTSASKPKVAPRSNYSAKGAANEQCPKSNNDSFTLSEHPEGIPSGSCKSLVSKRSQSPPCTPPRSPRLPPVSKPVEECKEDALSVLMSETNNTYPATHSVSPASRYPPIPTSKKNGLLDNLIAVGINLEDLTKIVPLPTTSPNRRSVSSKKDNINNQEQNGYIPMDNVSSNKSHILGTKEIPLNESPIMGKKNTSPVENDYLSMDKEIKDGTSPHDHDEYCCMSASLSKVSVSSTSNANGETTTAETPEDTSIYLPMNQHSSVPPPSTPTQNNPVPRVSTYSKKAPVPIPPQKKTVSLVQPTPSQKSTLPPVLTPSENTKPERIPAPSLREFGSGTSSPINLSPKLQRQSQNVTATYVNFNRHQSPAPFTMDREYYF